MKAIIVVGGIVALVFAPGASASTAEMQDANLVYRAAADEANVVSIVHSEDGLITVTDTGAVIQATNGCISRDVHVAECGHPSPPEYGDLHNHAILLADLDDSFEVFGVESDRAYGVDGGDGDDILLGGASGDGLDGGYGDDRLEGGAGDDRLYGGFGADVMRGGLGTDFASYYERGGPVRVEIGDGPGDGEAGEGDDVQVENVQGGAGDDVLIGNEVGNMLLGGPGADALSGRGGVDELDGNDVIQSGDQPAVDRVRCGAELDVVQTDGTDVAADNCEQIAHNTTRRIALERLERIGPRRIEARLRRVDFSDEMVAEAELSIPCGRPDADGIRCWDRVGRSPGPITAPRAQEPLLEIVLSRRGRLWLRRHPRRRPRVRVVAHDPLYPEYPVELRVRVNVPRP